MKLYALLVFAFPLFAPGQTKNDYEHAMQRFQKFYNAGKGDSINAMFGHEWDDIKLSHPIWTNDNNAERLKEFGYLKSFRFIGIDTSDPNKVYVFKTFFSKKGVHTTSLTLDSGHKLGTFRFITTPEGISKLLKSRKGN
jgi:hypothetical protein